METAGDHYMWTDERLNDRLAELAENRTTIEYTPECRQQVSREMAMVAFELSDRERERRGMTIAEAWGNCGQKSDTTGA